VPDFLIGCKRIRNRLSLYHGIGDEAEAVYYAPRYLSHWRRTTGAVEWLKGKL
jgi:hypothetical protein